QEIRRQLWLATDGAYKRAVEQLAQKRAALQNQTRAEHLPDFAKEPPAVLSDVVPAPPLDRAAAEALVRGLSAAFRAFPEVYSSGVSWSAGVVRTRYLNSEGSAFTRSSPWLVLRIHAAAPAHGRQSHDGAVRRPGRESLSRPDRGPRAPHVPLRRRQSHAHELRGALHRRLPRGRRRCGGARDQAGGPRHPEDAALDARAGARHCSLDRQSL